MRKRFLLSVASLLILTNFIEAQIAKGSLLLGGGIGFNSTITKTGNTEEKQNGFFFSPALGTAIKQNVIAGGDILISHTEYASVTSEKRTYNSYGAGVFFRKYIPVANKFFIYGQGRLGFSYLNNTYINNPDNSSKEKGFGIDLGINPGVSYALTNKLHLEAGFTNIAYLNYQHTKLKNSTIAGETNSIRNSFSLGSNLNNFNSSLYVGFRLLLNKK